MWKRCGSALGIGVFVGLTAWPAAAQDLTGERLILTAGPCQMLAGAGSPEGAVTANVCDSYWQTDVTGGTLPLWEKVSGMGTNTGWSRPPSLAAVNTWTGFGNHTWSAGGTGGNYFTVRNTTAGTGNYAGITVRTDSDTTGLGLWATSTTYTTSGQYVQNAGIVEALNAGGLSIAAPNSAIRFYAGSSSPRGSMTYAGAFNWDDTLGTSDYASQTTGWRVTEPGAADFRYLFTDEMHAKSFIADLEQALAGGQIIPKSVTMVAIAFSCPAAGGAGTLEVRDLPSAENMAVFESGDWVALRTFSRVAGSLTIADCVGQVTAYADSETAKQQTWTFTRGSGGSAGSMASSTTIAVDSLVLDYGVSGNGYYEVNSIDGTYGANSPYAQVVTWTTAPVAANRVVQTRLGKLTGITGTAGEYGLFAGTWGASSNYLRLSDEQFELHGIDLKMFNGAANTIHLDRVGPALKFYDGSGNTRAAVGNLDTLYGYSGTTYGFAAGDPSNAWVKVDATNGIRIGHNTTTKISLTAAGNASFSGSITAASGTIATFSIGAECLTHDAGSGVDMKFCGHSGGSAYATFGPPSPGPPVAWGSVGALLGWKNDTAEAVLWLYKDANNYFRWESGRMVWKAANTTLDSSGNLTATSASISGAITATSGSFTGSVYASAGYFGDSSNDVSIDSSGLSVGNTGSIRGGATAFDTGNGFFIGYSGGAYKLRIGEADMRPAFAWTGSDLEIKGYGYDLTDDNGLYFYNASDETDSAHLIRWEQGTVFGASTTYTRSWWRSGSSGGHYSQINLYPNYVKIWGDTTGGGDAVELTQVAMYPDTSGGLSLGTSTYKWYEGHFSNNVLIYGLETNFPTTDDDNPIVYSTTNEKFYVKTDGASNAALGSCASGIYSLAVESGFVISATCNEPVSEEMRLAARVATLEQELAALRALVLASGGRQ